MAGIWWDHTAILSEDRSDRERDGRGLASLDALMKREHSMQYVRIYELNAKTGHEQPMREALEKLSLAVGALDGCVGAEIIVDERADSQVRFVERWADRAAWEANAAALGKDAFADIMAAASERPAVFAGISRSLA